MATYDYGCEDCRIKVEKVHSMNESPSYNCPQCGKTLIKLFSLSVGGFFVRGGTPSSHWKEKRIRMKKREQLTNQAAKGPGMRIQPNIAGVEFDSWGDAQKAAKEAGMAHDSFQPWVEKEGKKIVVGSSAVSAPTKVITKLT